MGEVSLPVLPGDTLLSQAIDAMRDAGRSGVLMADGDDFVVLTADDILAGMRELGDVALARLDAQARTHVVPRHPTTVAPDLVRRVLDALGGAAGGTLLSAMPRASMLGSLSLGLGANVQGLSSLFASTSTPWQHGEEFTVLDAQHGLVSLPHESWTAQMGAGLIVCTCSQNRTHVWRPGNLAVAGKCNRDGAAVECR